MFLLNGDNDDIMEKITNCAAVLWTVVRVIMLCLLVIVIINRYYVYIISAFLDKVVIMIGIVIEFIMMLAKSNLIMM